MARSNQRRLSSPRVSDSINSGCHGSRPNSPFVIPSPQKPGRIRLLAALTFTFLFSLSCSALTSLEQIPVETFEKMREVERYQLKIAEKHYTSKNYRGALAEY